MKAHIEIEHEDGTVNYFSSLSVDSANDTWEEALSLASKRVRDYYAPQPDPETGEIQ